LASVGIIALTGSAVIVAIWVAIWYFAVARTRVDMPESALLKMYMGFTLFYPAVATAFTSLQEQSVVSAWILGAAFVIDRRDFGRAIRESRWFRVLTLGWVIWGTVAYLPVLLTWFMTQVLGFARWDWLGSYYAETSMSKTAVPAILAVGAAVLPLGALKTARNFQQFERWLFGATAALILLSAVEAVIGIRFVATTYQADPSRLVAFSIPDPNGYARLLLMPTLFCISFLMRRRVATDGTPGWIWLLAAAAICSLLLTLSRGNYAAFVAGLGALLALNFKRGRAVAVAGALGTVILIAFSVFGLATRFAPGEERRSPDNLSNRLVLYENILPAVRDNPWFGMHPGGYFDALANTEYVGSVISGENRWAPSAHNMLLGIAVEYGIPMAAFLFLALCATVVYGFRALNIVGRLRASPGIAHLEATAKAVIAISLAYFVHGLTSGMSFDWVFWLFGVSFAVWKCLAIQLSQQHSAAPTSARIPLRI
jgi:hypothetical protein